MKNHKHLIRLIIITAALIACGVFAFKYMRTYNNLSEMYHSKQAHEDVVIQTTEYRQTAHADHEAEKQNRTTSPQTKDMARTAINTAQKNKGG